MELSTVTMDRTEARKAFLEYRNAVRERHSKEDEQIMRGYRELSKGRQVLHLKDTISAGGLNDQGLPALAVSRADHTECFLDTWATRRIRYAYERSPNPLATRKAGVFEFRADILPGLYSTPGLSRYKAMVPPVPPALRPAHHLRNYVILWEVDKWEQIPQPPGDPALLKLIGGDLYALVATWDLTPLEQAVLSGGRLT